MGRKNIERCFVDRLAELCLRVVLWICGGRGSGKREILLQSIKFGLIGVSNTVLSYVLYVAVLYLLQMNVLLVSWDYLAAQAISFLLSVYWSFYWNDRLVFVLKEGQQREKWKALVKTYVSYSFSGLFLNAVLLVIWIDWMGISPYIAPIINLIVTVPVNFLLNKFWAFRVN